MWGLLEHPLSMTAAQILVLGFSRGPEGQEPSGQTGQKGPRGGGTTQEYRPGPMASIRGKL